MCACIHARYKGTCYSYVWACDGMCVYTYIDTCLPTTSLPTYLPAYLPTYLPTDLPTYLATRLPILTYPNLT